MVKQHSITKIGNIALSKGAYLTLMKRKGSSLPGAIKSKSHSCQNSPNVPRQPQNFASCAKNVIQGRALNFSNDTMFPAQKKRVPTPKTLPIHKTIQKSKNITNFVQNKSKNETKLLLQKKQQSIINSNKIISKHQYKNQKALKNSKLQASTLSQSSSSSSNNENKENRNPQLGNQATKKPVQKETKKLPQNKIQPSSQRLTRTALRSIKNNQISQSISIPSTIKKPLQTYYSPQKKPQIPWHKPCKDLTTRHTFFLPPIFANQQKPLQSTTNLRKSLNTPFTHNMTTRSQHLTLSNLNNNNKYTSSTNKFSIGHHAQKRRVFQGYEVKFITPKNQILQFNCFKERDLGYDKDVTDLINNNMDNDQETDDEQVHMAVRNVFMSLCKSVRDEQIQALQIQEQEALRQEQLKQLQEQEYLLAKQENEGQEEEEEKQDMSYCDDNEKKDTEPEQQQYAYQNDISMKSSLKSSVKSVYKEDEIYNDFQQFPEDPQIPSSQNSQQRYQIFKRSRQVSLIEEEKSPSAISRPDTSPQNNFSQQLQLQLQAVKRQRKANTRYGANQFASDDEQQNDSERDDVSCYSRYSNITNITNITNVTRRSQRLRVQPQPQQFEQAQEFQM